MKENVFLMKALGKTALAFIIGGIFACLSAALAINPLTIRIADGISGGFSIDRGATEMVTWKITEVLLAWIFCRVFAKRYVVSFEKASFFIGAAVAIAVDIGVCLLVSYRLV